MNIFDRMERVIINSSGWKKAFTLVGFFSILLLMALIFVICAILLIILLIIHPIVLMLIFLPISFSSMVYFIWQVVTYKGIKK